MTKNEAAVIERTLKSVCRFEQVFVVDSHSSDRTPIIAKEHAANLVEFTWNGEYPKKKEWCLLNLPFKHDWILYLDADEQVSEPLANEIEDLFKGSQPTAAAFDVELDYFFLGRMLRHGHRVTKRVLARRDAAIWPRPDDLGVSNMWEVEGHYQPRISGAIGRLSNRLQHNDPDPIYDYIARHNRYSDWEAHLLANPEVAKSVRGTRSAGGQRYATMPFKPIAFFIYSYLARRGFLDGRAGFHYATAHAFYFWLVSLKKREISNSN